MRVMWKFESTLQGLDPIPAYPGGKLLLCNYTYKNLRNADLI